MPSDRQKNELADIFDDYEIVIYDTSNKTIRNAKHLVQLMKERDCDEIVPVIPRAIRAKLVNQEDVKPLFAETIKLGRSNNRPKYRHQCFYRIVQEMKRIRLIQSGNRGR
jgi:hypothetical protein